MAHQDKADSPTLTSGCGPHGADATSGALPKKPKLQCLDDVVLGQNNKVSGEVLSDDGRRIF